MSSPPPTHNLPPKPDPAEKLRSILSEYPQNSATVALHALAVHYKLDQSVYTLSELLEALPAHNRELGLVDVLNIMVRMGFACERHTIHRANIDPRLLPFLWYDPAQNIMVFISEIPDIPIAGLAFFFKKQAAKRAQEKKEHLLFVERGWFVDTLLRFQSHFKPIFRTTLLLSLTVLFPPIFIMLLYNQLTHAWDWHALYGLGIGGLLVAGVDRYLRRLRSTYLTWCVARLDAVTQEAIFEKLIQLPAQAIETASIESQIARLKSFEVVRDFFASPLFLQVLDAPFVITSIALLAYVGSWLVLIPCAALCILIVLLFFLKPQVKNHMFHSSKTRTQLQVSYMETFAKRQTLVCNGMKQVWVEHIRELSAESANAQFRSAYWQTVFETACYGIGMIGHTMLIFFGVHLVWQGDLNGASLFACVLLSNRIVGPLQTVCSSTHKIEQLYRSVQQIDALMHMEGERDAAASLAKAYRLRGHIQIVKIGLRYNKESDPVLVGFSLDIQPGQCVVLSGETGAGKSTLLKLLLGLYRPQIGAIYLDGRDIRQIDPDEIRKKFAYIPEHTYVAPGSVLYNLRMSNPLSTIEEIRNALEWSGILSEIETWPQGLETPLSSAITEKFGMFPYVLSLSRAFLKQSPVWLIDDLPHFFLRHPLGQRFLSQLKTAQVQRTVVIASNAPEVLALADKAIWFGAGGKTQVGDSKSILHILQQQT